MVDNLERQILGTKHEVQLGGPRPEKVSSELIVPLMVSLRMGIRGLVTSVGNQDGCIAWKKS
jgi:hypothetical protein